MRSGRRDPAADRVRRSGRPHRACNHGRGSGQKERPTASSVCSRPRIGSEGAADRLERVFTAADRVRRSGRPHRAIPGSAADRSPGLRLMREFQSNNTVLLFTKSGIEPTKGCSSTRAERVNEQPLFHVIKILTGRIRRSLPQGRSGPTAKRQYARFFINTIAAPAASTAITAIIVTETSPVTGRGSVTGCGSSVTGCTAAFKETFAGLGTK